MIISFGWTADLLPPNGCKDTTRRYWSDRTLQSWKNAIDFYPTEWHFAFNKMPFAQGAKQIGLIRPIAMPYREPLRLLTKEEVAREGRPDLLSADDPVEAFIKEYFWKPKKSWDRDRRDAEWRSLLDSEPVVFRFEFRSLVSGAIVQARWQKFL